MSEVLSINTSKKVNTVAADQVHIERIKSPASSSNLSIEEYISIQSSTITNDDTTTSSPFLTENSASMTTTHSSSIVSQLNTTNATVDNYPPLQEIDFNSDLFYCIDRSPATPPDYDSTNPVKSIRYPIYEHSTPVNKNDKPPSYTPVINKITIASMKMERISPYEPSTSRAWKDYIVEINSTQLNFYSITETLSQEIKSLQNHHHYTTTTANSTTTTNNNIQTTKKKSNGFLSMISKDNSNYDLDETDQIKICKRIMKYKTKYMTRLNLVKSYTLQYGKYGIPIDYDKKPFVLRLRCESEQFLISFSHIDDMIMWSVYLSMGISVSLDLDFRELPNYRVVPRRRRRRRRGSRRRRKRRTQGRRRRIHTHHNNSRNQDDNNDNNNNNDLIRQNKNRSYSLSSMRSGLTNKNFRRNSTFMNSSENTDVTFSPSSMNDIGKILMLPSETSVSSLTNNTSNLSISQSSTRNVQTRTTRSMTTTTTTYKPSSFGGSSSSLNLSFKSKMKSLFKSSKNLSNNNKSGNNTIKFGSFVGVSGTSTDKYYRNRSMSTPAISSPNKNILSSSLSTTNTRNSSNASTKTTADREDQNHRSNTIKDRRHSERKITQSVINEINQHRQRRHDDEDDDDEDEEPEEDGFYSTDDHLTDGETDDYDEDEDDEEDDDEDTHFDESEENIYTEEGFLNEADEENDNDNNNEIMSGNLTFNNSFDRRVYSLSTMDYGSYESDDIKWDPEKKEMSRKRYIRDSLRCIRPFVEDQEWIGHIVFRPTSEPKFKTNNTAIWIGNHDGRKRFKYIAGSDFSNMKNHYLKAYVVGPVGFLKAETKVATAPSKLLS